MTSRPDSGCDQADGGLDADGETCCRNTWFAEKADEGGAIIRFPPIPSVPFSQLWPISALQRSGDWQQPRCG
jgi:hypothetical protein